MRLDTALAALRRGKLEISGEEALAFSQSFKSLVDLRAAIEDALKLSAEPPKDAEGPGAS